MKKALLLIAATTPTFVYAEHNLPIEVMEVVGEKPNNSLNIEMTSQAPLTNPVYDAGAMLRAITGMDAARRGGRGFEPIIRGQSQNQINVISDGAYSYSAGPGRMDPPTTYIGFSNFDKVTVIKGYRTVIHGAGGSGGTVLFEHRRPDFAETPILAEIISGYTSNTDADSLSVNVALGNQDAYIRVFGEQLSSGHYDDAKGNTVSAAFDSSNGGIILGGDLTANDYVEASHEQSSENDIFFAGNGMDAPYAESEISRLRWKHTGQFLFLDSLEANAYRSDVIHLMDNYSLRDRNPMMPSGMVTATASDTWGGRLLGTIETENYEIKLGVDYVANNRRARAFMDMGKDGSRDMLMSYLWPDLEQRRLGVFTEIDYSLTVKDSLRVGLRYDDYENEATKANEMVGMMGASTPSNLYQTYYGTNKDTNESEDLGVVLGWDRKLKESLLFSINLSRSIRHPDSNETFMARNAMNTIWVGNPDLAPEKHQQLDFTLMSNLGSSRWSATVFWNHVDDYIERYQDGNAALYHNISANLRGFELDASNYITDNLYAQAGISYTRGEGDNGDLANVAPLTGKLSLTYEKQNWAVGGEIITADRQTNFNEDVDVDKETPGFSVVNLFGHWQPTKQLILETGVENVFNKQYAYHVNKAAVDPFEPAAVRVFEPGRQYWVRARLNF